MADKVSIFNLALYKLKQGRITNPTQSVELSDIYEAQRDIVLAAHPWNFAVVRTSIPKDGTTTDWKYAYSYTLPADPWCLRVLGLEDPRAEWEVVADRKLVTDEGSPLKIAYIARVLDESRFSPAFVDALASKMAYEAGPKIAGISASRAAVLFKEYFKKISSGRSIDGQEGFFMAAADSDYLDARD